MALRLGKLFGHGGSAFWLNLQQDYDVWPAARKPNLCP
jgi:plasmid maintenance system antidote protein VapI